MSSQIRVGVGFDLHRLVPGRRCVLGGIEIPHDTGPSGHSDGDAVLHALADAVLGAAGLDDLGTLFPDDDTAWKDVDSKRLLRIAVERAAQAGWRPLNADLVVATEGPRIAPWREAMRESIGELLGLEADAVNVKGKSLEGMGELAGGSGLAVHAVCLLQADQASSPEGTAP
jgi:2-C-methyl-D-erythritol 2,4-cyclodiphosphate synthase